MRKHQDAYTSPRRFLIDHSRLSRRKAFDSRTAPADNIRSTNAMELGRTEAKNQSSIVLVELRELPGGSSNGDFIMDEKVSAFLRGVESGDTHAVELLIRGWPEWTKYGFHSEEHSGDSECFFSPLHKAVTRGDAEMVRVMLKYGGDANERDPFDVTLLQQAPSLDVARILLACGADANACGGLCLSPLGNAAKRGSAALAELLISHGADVNIATRGSVPLVYAAASGRLDLVQLLVASGTDLKAHGTHALGAACGDNHTAIVEFLIAQGVSVNPSSEDKGSPLHTAVYLKHHDLASLLLHHGADPNLPVQGVDDVFPINRAVTNCDKEMVQLLVTHGADTHVKAREGWTPLHYAVIFSSHFSDIIALLLDAGADINAEDNRGRTPVALADPGNSAQIKALRRYRTKQCLWNLFAPLAGLLRRLGVMAGE